MIYVSSTLDGFSTLGIKLIIVEFSSPRNPLDWNKEVIAKHTFCCTTNQFFFFFLKKLNPSGPSLPKENVDIFSYSFKKTKQITKFYFN